jgi:hypothetical protein
LFFLKTSRIINQATESTFKQSKTSSNFEIHLSWSRKDSFFSGPYFLSQAVRRTALLKGKKAEEAEKVAAAERAKREKAEKALAAERANIKKTIEKAVAAERARAEKAEMALKAKTSKTK